MNIVITGSLGHVSKPLTEQLVQQGHAVTVISSKADKQAAIETIGATAAVGSLQDLDFLKRTFAGADAVYCMVPPVYYYDHSIEPIGFFRSLADNYAQAIQHAGVRRVVHLSSFGAHLPKGTGFITGSHHAENTLNAVPGISVTHLRPTSFHYNLLHYTGMIKGAGFIAANYGGDDLLQFVAPKDIAAAAAEELVRPGKPVRYISSDELTGHEIAAILGQAIGRPTLRWVVITSDQMLNGLLTVGIAKHIAEMLVELYAAFHSGALSEDYLKNRPVLSPTKLTDFAQEFAEAFKK